MLRLILRIMLISKPFRCIDSSSLFFSPINPFPLALRATLLLTDLHRHFRYLVSHDISLYGGWPCPGAREENTPQSPDEFVEPLIADIESPLACISSFREPISIHRLICPNQITYTQFEVSPKPGKQDCILTQEILLNPWQDSNCNTEVWNCPGADSTVSAATSSIAESSHSTSAHTQSEGTETKRDVDLKRSGLNQPTS
ncbi:Amidohydrolase 1 [Macrophomina phaseolina MS6]|uniref:Amidohydrolase 1 n=1 Tax=Macrophomina phaseolina (strain MS6) TaxID=1126212 RepID=K2SNT7_MACPH|nr:Amidohydrolase 1 [Macrophomina phaseolina MS6]